MASPTGKTPITNIWMVTREYEGLAGAGGVKDVSRQLAEALARTGREITVVLPLYGFMNPTDKGFKLTRLVFQVDMPYVGVERRETVTIWTKKEQGVSLYLVDADRYREKRNVYLYTAEEEAENPYHRKGDGHFDYFAMNVLLEKATLALIILQDEKPSIIHCQDGHTAIIPVMMREIEGYRHYFRNTGALVTIHNAGQGYHQEVGDLSFAQTICNLPSRVIMENLLDGAFDPLLAASSYAIMNTVSENYARELRETTLDEETGRLGHRLLERGNVLAGVTNGISPADFDPTRPEKLGLAAAFDPGRGDLVGKRKCREDLITIINGENVSGVSCVGTLSDQPQLPLFTFIGRLTAQKGVDVLAQALENLLSRDEGFQVVILGSGDKKIEEALVQLAGEPRYLGRICLLKGYSDTLAHKIFAAGDFFLIPSHFEPCGLTDYMAQLMGNIPIVHHVGGLVKVEDGKTGLSYQENTPEQLTYAMERALSLYRRAPHTLKSMQQMAVRHIQDNYTWDRVVFRYLDLYQTAIASLHR